MLNERFIKAYSTEKGGITMYPHQDPFFRQLQKSLLRFQADFNERFKGMDERLNDANKRFDEIDRRFTEKAEENFYEIEKKFHK